ncbi:MAG: dCMP deaminase family protein [Bacilli bacterium]|nr:dCMP deaminase family protein [Bacilli bacterium]
MKNLNKAREDYLNWDEYFMAIARLSAMRSKDPSTQVGACIVGLDNRILSIGYNGAPNGFSDRVFPWERTGDMLNTKYAYVCHAEMNAILNYRGSRHELEKSKIYVDLFPCNECAKLIIQAGIKEVLFLSDKFKDKDGTLKETDAVKASKRMFDECGVTYHEINLANSKIEINLEKR